MKYLILFSVVIFLVNCASQPQAPSWIDDPGSVYAPDKYLTAVGQAESQEKAKRQALANLARIFSVSIHEQQLDSSTFTSLTGSTQTQVSRHVSVEAQNQLRGATVDKVFTDENGVTSAIAVLDKKKAIKDYKNQLTQLDSQIDTQLMFASKYAPNFVSALAALKRARSYQLKRENLDRDLIVLDGKGLKAKQNSGDIERLIRESTSKLAFDVTTNNAVLKSSIEAAMTEVGIAFSTTSSIKIKGNLDLDPPFQENNWYWVRGNLILNIIQNDKVISQKRWSLKQSAKQASIAQRRIDDQLNEQMADYLIETITTETSP